MTTRPKNFKCTKCDASFESGRNLQRHLERKKPCASIVDSRALSAAEKANPNRCRYCGRGYSRSDNLGRHLKTCRIANTEEGMEKLMEHTIQKQLAGQTAEVEALRLQVGRLTDLLEKQLLTPAFQVGPLSQVIANPVMNAQTVQTTHIAHQTINQNITQVTLRSWGGEERMYISAGMLRAAFTENGRLKEYCQLSDNEKVDAERATPYVLEALVDLVKRAHADPAGRNIYLNPRRADQVLVFDEETWRVLSLLEAIRGIFDSVAGSIQRIILTDRERAELPFEVQASASWIPNLYEDEPDKYVAKAKSQISAHLTNTTPPKLLGQ